MRKNLLLIALLSIFSMIACSKAEDTPISVDKQEAKLINKSFTVNGGGDLSKTFATGEEGTEIWFNTGDKVSVFDGTGNRQFTNYMTENAKLAKFTGEALEADSYSMLYPYQSDATFDGSYIYATIPNIQQAIEKTFDPLANLSVGAGISNITLKNVCSIIRFNTTKDCMFVTISDTKGGILSGKVKINPATGEAVPAAEGALKYVTLTNVKANTVYYIAVLPGTIDLKVEFETNEGKAYQRSKAGVELKRSTMLNIGKIAPTEEEMKQKWVDLDLPSGLLWATCNVGAENPTDYGFSVSWAETTSADNKNNDSGNWSEYKYYKGSNVTKYLPSDGLKKLLPEDDAASVNFGGTWRTSTVGEFQELINNCTWTWDSTNKGYIIKSKKDDGKSIFLPAAGARYNRNFAERGKYCYYWSSERSTDDGQYRKAKGIHNTSIGTDDRFDGRYIRPVKEKAK